MNKLNCWEFKRCGREPGGVNADSLGVCPSALENRFAGANSGKNAGRACWLVGGTFCDKKVQGTYAAKLSTCFSCDFYRRVMEEEGPDYQSSSALLERLAPCDISSEQKVDPSTDERGEC
jgi:hypothetical protein